MKVCHTCNKRIPLRTEEILDPCACQDYRGQYAKKGKVMNPITLEAFKKNRQLRNEMVAT